MQNQPRRPIGRLTVALTMIVAGLGLLASTLGLLSDAFVLIKLWPLILISLGAEFLFARWQGAPARFDWGGVILMFIFLGLLTSGAAAQRIFVGGGIPGRLFPGTSQTSTQTSLAVPADANRFEVDTQSGSVEIHGTSGSDITVDATFWGNSRGTATPQPRLVNAPDGALRLEFDAGDWTGVSARYVINLPQTLAINVTSNSGMIRVANMHSDVTLENHSGTLTVEQMEGKLNLSTQSGLVQVTDLKGALTVTAHSGAIRLSGINGPVDAQTQSGLIALDLASGVGAQVSAEAGSGIIRGPSWLTVTRSGATQRAAGQVGNGEFPVRLETGSGSISVGAR